MRKIKNGETPITVRRVVDKIDEIVRAVGFDNWQAIHSDGFGYYGLRHMQNFGSLRHLQKADKVSLFYPADHCLIPNLRLTFGDMLIVTFLDTRDSFNSL